MDVVRCREQFVCVPLPIGSAYRKNKRINGEAIMSSITADGLSAPVASDDVGPLEQKHLQYANYRAVAGGTAISKTHWHIALANGLGWGFDGMGGVIFG